MSPDTLTITRAHLDGFAAVSGDHNPIHIDAGFAARTAFRQPVAHGMFLFGLVSAAVQRRFPGSRIAAQQLMFPSPTPIGARVTVAVDVADCATDEAADGAQHRGGVTSLLTTVIHDDGAVGLRGTCTIERTPDGDRVHSGARRASSADDLGHPDAGRNPAAGAAVRAPTGDAASSWWERAVGRTASLTRAFAARDVANYAALSNDTGTAGGIPAPLIGGLLSTLLGMHLPGPGTNYLKQSLRLVSVGSVDERLAATVQIVRAVPDKRLVYLATTVTGREGRLIADGRALVLAGGIASPR